MPTNLKVVMSRTLDRMALVSNTPSDETAIERLKEELPFDLNEYLNCRFLTYRATKEGKRVWYMLPLTPVHLHGPEVAYAVTQSFCVSNDLYTRIVSFDKTPIVADSITIVVLPEMDYNVVASFDERGVRISETPLLIHKNDSHRVLTGYTFYSAAGYAPDFLMQIFSDFAFGERDVAKIIDPYYHDQELYVFMPVLPAYPAKDGTFAVLLKMDRVSGEFVAINSGYIDDALQALISIPYMIPAREIIFVESLHVLPVPREAAEEGLKKAGCQLKPRLPPFHSFNPKIGFKNPADVYSHYSTGNLYTPLYSAEEDTRWFLRVEGSLSDPDLTATNALSNIDDVLLRHETTVPSKSITVSRVLAKGEIEMPILEKGFTMTDAEPPHVEPEMAQKPEHPALTLSKIKKRYRWSLRKTFSKKQFRRELLWAEIRNDVGQKIDYVFEVRDNEITNAWRKVDLGLKDKHFKATRKVAPQELTYVKDTFDRILHKKLKSFGIKHTLNGGAANAESTLSDLVVAAVKLYVDTKIECHLLDGMKTRGRENEIQEAYAVIKKLTGWNDLDIVVMLTDLTRVGVMHKEWSLLERTPE